MKKIFKIDPLKSFIELPILWISITFLFIIALGLTLIIISNSSIELFGNYESINSLVDIFKVPLAILALIVTIIAILAATHRSMQTKEQILSTQKQNTFSNYFKHIEEFEKYISKSFDNKSIHFNNPRITHKYLFPNAFDGDYTINEIFIELVDQKYSECKTLLDTFKYPGDKVLFDLFYSVFDNIDYLFSTINCKIGRSGRQLVVDGKKIVLSELYLRGAFQDIKNNSIALEQILLFDHTIIIPRSLKVICNLDISVVPHWSLELNKNIKEFNVFLGEA
jgi:hypothetical protein